MPFLTLVSKAGEGIFKGFGILVERDEEAYPIGEEYIPIPIPSLLH